MNNTLHLYNRDRVQVAAHRGVAGVNIPCNTIPAFDIALHGGAAILEMRLLLLKRPLPRNKLKPRSPRCLTTLAY